MQKADDALEHPNPVRAALVSFFSALLASDDDELHDSISVYRAASIFSAVANVHFDLHATPSDAIYARFVSALKHLSLSQLRKLCAGFRVIKLDKAYLQLNQANVSHNEGIKALMHGCRHGIIPTALSYRHSPHELAYFEKHGQAILAEELEVALADVDGAAPNVIERATVSRETAARFVHLNRSQRLRTDQTEAVVWIDRAVRGLSSDGEWFVRGLLPYCLAVICPAYTDKSDFKRPWIWLEWKLSSRVHSSSQLVAAVDSSDILLIAIQALYIPAAMLQQYEYAHEMEQVVLDMTCFGLSVQAGIQGADSVKRKNSLRDWSDYKVGLVVVSSFTMGEMGNGKDGRIGALYFDGRDSYGCGLFTDGLQLLLGSFGIRVDNRKSLESSGVPRVEGYKLFDRQFVATKTVMADTSASSDSQENGNELTGIATRVPVSTLESHKELWRYVDLESYLEHDIHNVEDRYDLRNAGSNCDLSLRNTSVWRHFDGVDALAVLACCEAELAHFEVDKENGDFGSDVSEGKARSSGRDDAHVIYFPSVCNQFERLLRETDSNISDENVQRMLCAYSRSRLRLKFNYDKASSNSLRKRRYRLREWIDRVERKSGRLHCEETRDRKQNLADSGPTARVPEHNLREAQTDSYSIWIWMEFRRNILRWVEARPTEEQSDDGHTVTLRRLDLRGIANGNTSREFTKVIQCERGCVSKMFADEVNRIIR